MEFDDENDDCEEDESSAYDRVIITTTEYDNVDSGNTTFLQKKKKKNFLSLENNCEFKKNLKTLESCHWNFEFQEALDDVKRMVTSPKLSYQERESVWHRLSTVSKDFAYASKTYGRIIISEVNLPVELKQIKPVKKNELNGFAGGEKYIVNSILFKFAIDSSGYYAGNEIATWIQAGQDLLCLNAYSRLAVSGLIDRCIAFPLCCLVDYRGFRLVCLSLIPMAPQSLVYGSPDSGKTLYNDPEVAPYMDKIAKELNLKKHYVAKRTSGPIQAELFSSCADLELHRGLDGRYYLLDFARAMPPQDPEVQSVPQSHLTQKLRPEFVLSYPKSLNPDAFSNFIGFLSTSQATTKEEKKLLELVGKDSAESEKDIREATEFLINHHIPTVAKRLPEFTKNLNLQERRILLEDWLPFFVHFYGINIRWIGVIRNQIPSSTEEGKIWKNHILIESVARVIKHNLNNRLRSTMRTCKTTTGEAPFIETVTNYLNLVFGEQEESIYHWEEMDAQVTAHFPKILEAEDDSQLKSLVSQIQSPDLQPHRNGLCMLFDRVCEILKLQYRPSVKNQFSSKSERFLVAKPFDVTDLLSLDEHVKCNHVIAHSQGSILRMRATSAKNHGDDQKEYSESLFKEALMEFRQSLQAVPQSTRTIQNMADVFYHLGYPNLALLFYRTAIDADVNDARAYHKLGQFLHRVKRFDEVAGLYEKSQSLEPSLANMIAYASFLTEVQQETKAADILSQALELYPTDCIGHHAYANFVKGKDGVQADHHYKLALQYDPHNLELLKDYSTFLSERGMEESSQKYFAEYQRRKRQSTITLMDSFTLGIFKRNSTK